MGTLQLRHHQLGIVLTKSILVYQIFFFLCEIPNLPTTRLWIKTTIHQDLFISKAIMLLQTHDKHPNFIL